ncbi:MAG: hypothetical protein GY804_06470 [Alphaproteobacteria bacterium]|nr:hypothetical protein [Alphaproteobacteria bacterium]
MTKIIITALDEEAAPGWRTVRIKNTIKYIKQLAALYKTNNILNKIHSLRDEKGELIAKWHNTPSTKERRIVNRAWLLTGDSTTIVHHKHKKLPETITA